MDDSTFCIFYSFIKSWEMSRSLDVDTSFAHNCKFGGDGIIKLFTTVIYISAVASGVIYIKLSIKYDYFFVS